MVCTKIIREKNTEEYCLLDVRQPAEYAEKHIPGAKLVPLGELQDHMSEVDADRPIIVYCRSGNRSRSAVGMLNGAGFEDVYNMEGGMLAYNGVVAMGPPEAGVFCFPESMSPAELVAMAFEHANVPLGSGAASTTPADISRSHVLNYLGNLVG